MKKYKTLLTTTILFAVVLGGCKEDDLGRLNNVFTVSSPVITFEENILTLSGIRQTVKLNVATGKASGNWSASSPSNDLWLSVSESEEDVIITVAEHNGDIPRTSRINIFLGEETRYIEVVQEHRRRLEFLSGASTTIGASEGRVVLPLRNNCVPGTLTISIVPEDCQWINPLVLGPNDVSFGVLSNPSGTEKRQCTIIVSGEGQTASIVVTQNAMVGFPYVIDLSNASFEDCYIYEIWDEVNNLKIGELCKEFLHKASIVRRQTLVVYPMSNNRVDLSNGLVIDNGYFVAWNTRANVSSNPADILSFYIPGETVTGVPTEIYLDPGAPRMTTQNNIHSTRIEAKLRPLLLHDQRSGEANNQGQTSENNFYRIVKIGNQYWMADNLRTTRYADNGSPIPTNIVSADWNNAMSPGCAIAFREPPLSSSFSSFADANSTSAAAVAARNRVGVSYNFHAITRTTASRGVAIPNASIVDRLSPSGWRVPDRNHFQLLLNYVYQSSALPSSAAELNGYSTNESGFSAIGNMWRMNTGSYSSHTDYQIMTYTFRPVQELIENQHVSEQFRIETNNVPDTPGWRLNQTTQKASYVRCIRIEN